VRRGPTAALAAALVVLGTVPVMVATAGTETGYPPPAPTPAADGVEVRAVRADDPNRVVAARSPIAWRPSRALGEPYNGRLVNGTQLPAAGPNWVTWDPIQKRRPNRGWRRWGTDRLLRVLLRVAREFRAVHRAAPPLLIGDLSRRRGGDFGPRFGPPGHASHQNGLDVDIYYPRLDRRLRAPTSVSEVDLRLAQDLVRRFVAARAEYVFVGPHTDLRGPKQVVQPLDLHDDHMHVRLYNPLR
jgi:murein endopeptidase